MKLTNKEKCQSCHIVHKQVECIGIFHCPNALCRGSGGAWFRHKLDSYKETHSGMHTVDEEEYFLKGTEYNKKNKIKVPKKDEID